MKQKLTNVDIFDSQKIRGKRVDYKQLNDPMSEIEDDM